VLSERVAGSNCRLLDPRLGERNNVSPPSTLLLCVDLNLITDVNCKLIVVGIKCTTALLGGHS
jgi:hypothetical protein